MYKKLKGKVNVKQVLGIGSVKDFLEQYVIKCAANLTRPPVSNSTECFCSVIYIPNLPSHKHIRAQNGSQPIISAAVSDDCSVYTQSHTKNVSY